MSPGPALRLLPALCLLLACGGGGGDDGPPAGGPDATVDGGADVGRGDGGGGDGGAADGGGEDGGGEDGGGEDGGGEDAGDGAEAGFGAIAGPCGRVATELDEASPSFFLTHLDFMADPFDDPGDVPLLTAGGQELLAEGTAGGSSIVSELFAYEVLARCEGADLLKSETEIVYRVSGKITDMLVTIDGRKVGVSVTRAIAFPFDSPYTVTQATSLLTGKLSDVQMSSANVAPEDAWLKQILVVVAYADMHAESVRAAWEGLDASVRADTVVYVVVTDGDDSPLY